MENYISKLNAPDEAPSNPKSDVYYESMREKWQGQLGEMDMTDKQAQIATYLMGTLDDAGYLHADMQAIVNELLYTENIQTNIEEVEYVLTHFVQELIRLVRVLVTCRNVCCYNLTEVRTRVLLLNSPALF